MQFCMQNTQLALTQFPDEFQDKVHHKHQGVVKIKVNLFMKVFEVDDHPLWMVIVLCGWRLSFLIGESALGGVAPPWA